MVNRIDRHHYLPVLLEVLLIYMINKAGTKLFAAVTGRNPDRSLAGVWISDNGNGGSWTSHCRWSNRARLIPFPGWKPYNNIITAGEFASGWGRVTFALAPSNQNLLYVLYENAENASSAKPEADLFRCDMSATPFTWTNLSANLTAKLNGTSDNYFQSQGGYNLTVAVHPTQSNIVFAGGVNLYRSTDGFSTTANVVFVGGNNSNTYDDPDDASHVDFHFIAFDPSNPNRMVTTSDGGLVSTENAASTEDQLVQFE